MGHFEDSLEFAIQQRDERIEKERLAQVATRTALQESIDTCMSLLPELELGIQELRTRTQPPLQSYDDSKIINRHSGTRYWIVRTAKKWMFVPEEGEALVPRDKPQPYICKKGVLYESFWKQGQALRPLIHERVHWVHDQSCGGIEDITYTSVAETIVGWTADCASQIVNGTRTDLNQVYPPR